MASRVGPLRAALLAVADPERAPKMQAYMKSAMPYAGVAMPIARGIFKDLFKAVTWPDRPAWERDVREIWTKAKYREERYGAIFLTGVKGAAKFQDAGALPIYEHLIVTGAWWDFVDEIAGHRLFALLRNDEKPVKQAMIAWSTDADLWKRRASILCQLKMKADTDLQLLYRCIEPSLASKEFFLRKAIGWALRQYAYVDAAEVRRFVTLNDGRLSPLSKREALKNLGD